MKRFLSLLAVALLVSTTASAFSLGDVADTGKVKMKKCVMEQAKDEFMKGKVNSSNIEERAKVIVASCATASSVEASPDEVKAAVEVLNSLMK